jgi:hypothetical protein
MLQAEVGSAKITQAHRYPTRGLVMCDFTLPSTDGKRISLYDYRGHHSPILASRNGTALLPEPLLVVANNLLGRHCSAMSPTATARTRNASRLNLLSAWAYCGLR